MATLKAFEIEVNGKAEDYRLGKSVDLLKVREFFSTTYGVKKLWPGGRHVLGVLTKGENEYFVKLATSPGISAVTQNEYRWNETYNHLVPRPSSPFLVPLNIEQGWFGTDHYYYISEMFTGIPLAPRPEHDALSEDFQKTLPDVIRFAEAIADLPVETQADHLELFRTKTRAWYEAIPEGLRNEHDLSTLLAVAEEGAGRLLMKVRHGDFTPWHLFRLESGNIGLIDGEHFLGSGVEYYDLAYFIQRLYTILEAPQAAVDLTKTLLERGYDKEKLRVVLAARGIGGFLDATLAFATDFSIEKQFQTWVLQL